MSDFNVNDEFAVAHELGFMRDDDFLREGDMSVVFADINGDKFCGVVLEEVPESPPQNERLRVLATMGEVAAHAEACVGVLIAIRRAGSPDLRGDDLAWHDALATIADRFHLVSHGAYIVTDEAVTRVEPLANAA